MLQTVLSLCWALTADHLHRSSLVCAPFVGQNHLAGCPLHLTTVDSQLHVKQGCYITLPPSPYQSLSSPQAYFRFLVITLQTFVIASACFRTGCIDRQVSYPRSTPFNSFSLLHLNYHSPDLASTFPSLSLSSLNTLFVFPFAVANAL